MPERHEEVMVHLEAPPEALGRLWDGSPALAIVADFAGELSKLARVRAIVAIGSRARGCWKPWSDIDLVFVCDRDIRPQLPGLRNMGLIDPRPYTPESLMDGILRCDVDLIEAFEDGIVLYDDGVWRRAGAVYEHVKALLGVERHGPGWRVKRRMKLEELEEVLAERGVSVLDRGASSPTGRKNLSGVRPGRVDAAAMTGTRETA